MAKNDKLINSIREIAKRNREQNQEIDRARAANNTVPILYASLAIALKRYWGFGIKRTQRLFAQSQAIWDEFTENGLIPDEIIQACIDETGIELINAEEAMKRGIE